MTTPKRSFKPEGSVIEVSNRVSDQLPRDDHGRVLLDQLIDEALSQPDIITICESGKSDV